MAVWAHSSGRLYYQEVVVTSAGQIKVSLLRWNAPASIATEVAGFSWDSPSLSPDDRLAAYAVTDKTGTHLVIRDMTSGSVRALAGTRGQPIYLASDLLFEVHYTLSTGPLGSQYIPSRYYLLNTSTNVETLLPAAFQPMDVWPH
jgi:hypothetical protein